MMERFVNDGILANLDFFDLSTCVELVGQDESIIEEQDIPAIVDVNVPLKRSQKTRRSTIPDDYEVVFGVSAAWKAEGEEKEKTIVSVKESIVFLEKQLEGRKFFGGEKIGYLDLVLGWILHWTGVMEEVGDMKLLEKDNFTLIHEWSQNFTHIPIIKECLPPRENLLNHVRTFVSYFLLLAADKP
ncbi:glutathione transferase GST 23-like [Ziziphus jujuba]|uniref:Glutathione transferase GST 23-like n=1 Tax=Ziziphus jujuba TaxID=326968 RepID=A0ABM4A2M0_ZIZJJ|nr:glutathione transferase GST 23-like [Ziziphus jujuba]